MTIHISYFRMRVGKKEMLMCKPCMKEEGRCTWGWDCVQVMASLYTFTG